MMKELLRSYLVSKTETEMEVITDWITLQLLFSLLNKVSKGRRTFRLCRRNGRDMYILRAEGVTCYIHVIK
jgi:hypothetical protein